MKKYIHYFLSFFAFILITNSSSAQEKTIIRLGVKTLSENKETEKKISNHEYNFIDAFEYELIKELMKYVEKDSIYSIELVTVAQSNKLSEIINGSTIDALLFTFSETQKRKDTGVYFSVPYFQNKAISVIVNNPNSDIKKLSSIPMRVGAVDNTTTENELKNLKKLKKEYKNNLTIMTYDSHAELIEALNIKEIDAAAGDVSRLIYDLDGGDFYFGGNLPTRRSKVRDNYAIAVRPQSPELVNFFDSFISDSEEKIKRLEQKWLSTAFEEAYQSYYNKEEDRLKEYIIYIAIGALVMLLSVILTFFYILKKKEIKISKMKKKKYEEKLSDVFSIYDAKGRSNIEAEDIAKVGISFFNNAKKITYVGSGGFLSDPKLGTEWSEALHNFLAKKDTVFERVVDLPEMHVNQENEICFKKTFNFNTSLLGENYTFRYLKWLCIQYHGLINHKNLTIIDSRGAALWGYGIIIIIMDEIEVLMFTTNKNKKIGSSIRDSILAKQISEVIFEVIEIGAPINLNKFTQMFFKKDPRLIEIKKEIDATKGKGLSKELIAKIDTTCKIIAGL